MASASEKDTTGICYISTTQIRMRLRLQHVLRCSCRGQRTALAEATHAALPLEAFLRRRAHSLRSSSFLLLVSAVNYSNRALALLLTLLVRNCRRSVAASDQLEGSSDASRPDAVWPVPPQRSSPGSLVDPRGDVPRASGERLPRARGSRVSSLCLNLPCFGLFLPLRVAMQPEMIDAAPLTNISSFSSWSIPGPVGAHRCDCLICAAHNTGARK